MDGRNMCCRYEPRLEDLLADEMMAPVLRSAGFDRDGFRELMVETARRFDTGRTAARRIASRSIDHRTAGDEDRGR